MAHQGGTGGETGPKIAMTVTSWRWRRKRLGGEENEGGSVGNDGERRGEGTPGQGRGKRLAVAVGLKGRD
jgi:hypothetical protein